MSTRFRKRLAATFAIGILGLIWGLMLLQLNIGQGLRRASYDLPFLSGGHPPPGDFVLIRLDEASHQELGQPLAKAWDRRLHAQLVEKLTTAGARMIVFDILFHDENPDQDEAFATSIKNHGNVVLTGELVRNETEGAERESLLLATPALRRAAVGWGLSDMPVDSDGVVRRVRHLIPTPFGEKPGLAEFVRQRNGKGMPEISPGGWLNHYGPANTFPAFSYSGVLLDRGIPADAFREKIVVIGARQKSGLSDAGKDTFATPYTLLTRELSPGMEIQATAMANLLDGSEIRRAGHITEIYLIVISAFLFAAASCLLPPLKGVPATLALGVGIALIGFHFHRENDLLILWAIPALGQAPLVAGLSLGAHYLIEYSARWRLRRAFRSYMSDEQARQIDEDSISLELGGKEVDATILFSDLAGFTSISEGLPPQAVSKALISYFERTTEGILDNNGTIIKYIGDAVMATWGAPLKVDREADRAIDAAIQMQIASKIPITLETAEGSIEQVLETRIGINSGPGLAGNLGSKRRFDYSVIGDTTNTAARLEGLNKMLGTSILVSQAVLDRCTDPDRFLKRKMGSFVLKGKKRGIVVYEILGHIGESIRERSPVYLENYQNGLDAFAQGDWERANCFLIAASRQHDRLPEDPASQLILKEMAGKKTEDSGGEIVLDTK